MPAGDLLTANSQFEIRTTLFGTGNNSVWIAREQIEGIGIVEPKTSDVDLWGQPGAEGNPEYDDVRVISIPTLIVAATPATAISALATLRTAWANSTTDIPLCFRLGGVKMKVTGRPRGGRDDLSRLHMSIIEVLLRFDGLDPTITIL